MSQISNNKHQIYRERGRLNRQIGLLLFAFVVLVMVATVAKLSTGRDELAETSPTNEASQ